MSFKNSRVPSWHPSTCINIFPRSMKARVLPHLIHLHSPLTRYQHFALRTRGRIEARMPLDHHRSLRVRREQEQQQRWCRTDGHQRPAPTLIQVFQEEQQRFPCRRGRWRTAILSYQQEWFSSCSSPWWREMKHHQNEKEDRRSPAFMNAHLLNASTRSVMPTIAPDQRRLAPRQR